MLLWKKEKKRKSNYLSLLGLNSYLFLSFFVKVDYCVLSSGPFGPFIYILLHLSCCPWCWSGDCSKNNNNNTHKKGLGISSSLMCFTDFILFEQTFFKCGIFNRVIFRIIKKGLYSVELNSKYLSVDFIALLLPQILHLVMRKLIFIQR